MPELNDYFDSARHAEPPLGKDEVSNILAQRLSEGLAEHQKRETAHTRGIGAWMRGFRRTFIPHSLKGWIMISLLTGAVVALFLLMQPTHRFSENPKLQSEEKVSSQIPTNLQKSGSK